MSNNLLPSLTSLDIKGRHNCPDCFVLMRPFRCESIIIDKCDKCNGIWFDHNEFGVFKRALDKHDLSIIGQVYKPEKDESVVISGCPKCNDALSDINYSYKSGVTVKKCMRCNGLWVPIYETLNLIELTMLSQSISEDVKAYATELTRLTKLIDKNKAILEVKKHSRPSYFLSPLNMLAYITRLLFVLILLLVRKIIK